MFHCFGSTITLCTGSHHIYLTIHFTSIWSNLAGRCAVQTAHAHPFSMTTWPPSAQPEHRGAARLHLIVLGHHWCRISYLREAVLENKGGGGGEV